MLYQIYPTNLLTPCLLPSSYQRKDQILYNLLRIRYTRLTHSYYSELQSTSLRQTLTNRMYFL